MGSGANQRDPVLDLWRGLALVDMAWVHLARYPIGMPAGMTAWIGDHTRFAAGALVLLSGLTIARVFGPALERGGEPSRRARVRILRRAVLLLFVDRLASVVFSMLERARVVPVGSAAIPPDWWSLATFDAAGATGGLLLLYALMLAAVPALYWLRSHAGDAAVVGGSLGLYGCAQLAGGVAHWPPWAFPVLHWQPLFVAGCVAGSRLDRLRAADPAARRLGLACISVVFAAAFAVRNGAAVGLAAVALPASWFEKVPLRPSELAWYLAASAFMLAWTAWTYRRSSAVRGASGWLCRLGRQSLVVYVAHLFLEVPIIELVTRVDPSPLARAAMLPLMAAGMTGVAVASERFDRWQPSSRANPLAMLQRAFPTGGTIGGAVAAASAGAVLVLRMAMAPPFDADVAQHAAGVMTADLAVDELGSSADYRALDFPDRVPPLLDDVDAEGAADGGPLLPDPAGDGDFHRLRVEPWDGPAPEAHRHLIGT